MACPVIVQNRQPTYDFHEVKSDSGDWSIHQLNAKPWILPGAASKNSGHLPEVVTHLPEIGVTS